MRPPALPTAATPTWNDPPPPAPRVLGWIVVAAGLATVIASVVGDTSSCSPASPCSADWVGALVVPLLVGSMVLAWWWPVVGLALGLGGSSTLSVVGP